MNLEVSKVSLSELGRIFLKLGATGFGGPAAHVAMMRKEFVEKRQWVNDQEFMDLVGATQLIPGPNSTELAIHLGFLKAGWKGLVLAGVAFILPAFFLVMILSVFYGVYGSLPIFEPVMAGIRPVIVAIILEALWKFRKTAIKNFSTLLMGTAALIFMILGFHEIYLLFGFGILYGFSKKRLPFMVAAFPMSLGLPAISLTSSGLFFFFLKIGSVLFGSGYVLLSLLRSELVEKSNWLTDQQLLDAITVGQITPGPVFTTATFIGYLLMSYKGAMLATIGIFLPSFLFVGLSAPFLPKLRSSPFLAGFLDGVNAVSFMLLLKVTFDLGTQSLIHLPTILIGLLSFIVLLKFTRLNSIWLILLGAIFGALFLK